MDTDWPLAVTAIKEISGAQAKDKHLIVSKDGLSQVKLLKFRKSHENVASYRASPDVFGAKKNVLRKKLHKNRYGDNMPDLLIFLFLLFLIFKKSRILIASYIQERRETGSGISLIT